MLFNKSLKSLNCPAPPQGINGMLIENDALEIQQVSSTDLRLNLNTTELGYSIDSNDEVIGFGKFNS